MDDVIQIHDHHYILASSARIEERTRVLKHGDTFAVFDRMGDVRPVGLGEEGLYHEGTRFLSRLTLRLAGKLPMLLSSTSSTRAASAPSAASAGTMIASSARLGIVCTTLARPSTGASSARRRVTAMPSGTLASAPAPSATSVSWRCARR